MAGEKNFNVKNGLSVGGVEVINSSGDLVAGGVGTAVNEAIADKIGGIVSATGGATATYNDGADTIVIDVAILDSDTMSGASATTLSSSESIKAYVDAQVDTADALSELTGDSDDITEGSTNLFHTSERVADVVGGMVGSNTETGIAVTYDDADNTLDFVVGTLNQNTTGSAATLTTARTIGGVSFDGSANINLPGVNTAGTVDTSGNAATATALETARTIHGVSFDGTGNIDLSEVVQDTVGAMFTTTNTETGITATYQDATGDIDLVVGTLNQDTTGNADTATALATARTIQGVSFDGSANITTLTAGTGVAVSGTAVSIGQSVATSAKPSFAGVTLTGNSDVTGNILPSADDTYDLGSATKQWKDVYIGPGSLYVNGQKVVEDNSGTITISADANQNVAVSTSGSGDIELSPTGTGQVEVKGPMQITASKAISSSDGNAIAFSNSIDVDAIESRSADTNLTLTANGTGIVTVNDALTVTGNLTVGGTTTTVNSETINLADNIIVLNSNFTAGTPSEDTGFSVLRGASATKSLIWDESEDEWTVGSEKFVAGTFEGNLTGNVTGNTSGSSGSTTGNAATATALATARTISLGGDASGSASFDGTGNITITATVADDSHNHTIANVDSLQTTLDAKYQSGSNVSLGTIASGAITITNATNAGGTARNVYQSTSAPTGGAGAVGDLWVLYS
jgi:hypothetical protein